MKMGNEWMRRGRKKSWEGEQWIVLHRRRHESEEAKNRDKRIVVLKLIIWGWEEETQ
jgi:hypothetical protein